MEHIFVLRGRLQATLEDTFAPVSVIHTDRSTELRLEIEDDAHLYGVLASMERLGLSIERFRPVRKTDNVQRAD